MSIALEQVVKRFGQLVVLDRVSLEVEEGELFVLLGESGSGKTTILRLIAGLVPLDSGAIHLRGREVSHLPPQARGVGFVFQSYSLFQHMTVAQNVEFGLMIRRVPAADRRRRREQLLELVDLAGLDQRYPAQLSGGQQQRVALARALAYEPEVMLLDEPFGALDATTRGYLRGELRRIQRELGLTTIFVTHDREEAFQLADRIGVLHRGRLVASGAPEALYRRPSTAAVAKLLGESNFLVGRVESTAVQVGERRLPLEGAEAVVEQGHRVLLHFRPEQVELAPEAEGLSGYRLGQATVGELVFAGAQVKAWLTLGAGLEVPTPAPPAYDEEARRVQALVPTERRDLLGSDRLWVGVKNYTVLPSQALRFLVLGRPQELEALHGFVEPFRAAEAVEVEEQVLEEVAEPATIWAQLAARRPEVLVLPRPQALPWLEEEGMDADALLRRVGLVVLAVPPGDFDPRRMLVATAAGAPGREDVRFAARLARRIQADVTLLHVLDQADLPPDLDELARRDLPQARHLRHDLRLLESVGVRARPALTRGDVVDEIAAAVRAGRIGLVVLGAHLPAPGISPGERDIAHALVRALDCPTAVVYAEVR